MRKKENYSINIGDKVKKLEIFWGRNNKLRDCTTTKENRRPNTKIICLILINIQNEEK